MEKTEYQECFLSASLVFFSKSDLFVLNLVFKTNPLVSTFTFPTNLSYTVFFLATSLFTTFLSLLKSTGTALTLSTSILSTLAFNLKLSGHSQK